MKLSPAFLPALALGLGFISVPLHGAASPGSSTTPTPTPVPEGGATPPTSPASPEKDGAIGKCLEVIRQARLPNGMLRLRSEGEKVWVVPYFSNIAVMGLLAAHAERPNPGDLEIAIAWARWYAAHQNPDGTTFDYEGTLDEIRSTLWFDSTDSYPSTHLQVLWRLWRATRDAALGKEFLPAAHRSLDSIAMTMDPRDGLTYCKPNSPVKYLMDNLEVAVGLMEGIAYFRAMDDTAGEARAQKLLEANRRGLGKFWSQEKGFFAYQLDPFDNGTFAFAAAYPEGMANYFAAAYLKPSPRATYDRVEEAFGASSGVYRLLGARRSGTPEKQEELAALFRGKALKMTPGRTDINEAAITLMALLGEKAMWPAVEAPWEETRESVFTPLQWQGGEAAMPEPARTPAGLPLDPPPLPRHSPYYGEPPFFGLLKEKEGETVLEYDIRRSHLYIGYLFPLLKPADFSEAGAVAFTFSFEGETERRKAELSFFEADGDVWTLPMSDGENRIALAGATHNPWSPGGDGTPDWSRITGYRVQISSLDGAVSGEARFSRLRLLREKAE